ncbi:MAG: DNA repair exonuclease [Desulfurococcaceae archaeon]
MLIHTSDLHIGCAMSVHPFLGKAYIDVLEEIAEKVMGLDARTLVVAGDMFDKVVLDNYDLLIRSIKILRNLRDNGKEIVVVPGNHDNSRYRKGILELLDESGLIRLLRYEELSGWMISLPLLVDNVVYYGIPGFRGGKEIEYIDQGKVRFKGINGKGDRHDTVVVAHMSVKFSGFDPASYHHRYGKLSIKGDDLLAKLPSNTKYVALGHIHMPIPLEKAFKSNIAYSGAPLGMDLNDMEETYELAKKGISRRVLLIDLSHEPPLVKALELDNVPKVALIESSHINVNDLLIEVNSKVKDMSNEYKVFIVRARSIQLPDARLHREIAEMENRYKVMIRVRSGRSMGIASALLGEGPVIDVHVTGDSIFEIEKKIVKEILSRQGLSSMVDKAMWLIDQLSLPKSSEPDETYYRRLLDEILREMKEVIEK